jgi:hypothetical protein
MVRLATFKTTSAAILAARETGESMAQNHYVTKPNRRAKSGKRKDPSAATMAKLRKLAAAEAQKTGK